MPTSTSPNFSAPTSLPSRDAGTEKITAECSASFTFTEPTRSRFADRRIERPARGMGAADRLPRDPDDRVVAKRSRRVVRDGGRQQEELAVRRYAGVIAVQRLDAVPQRVVVPASGSHRERRGSSDGQDHGTDERPFFDGRPGDLCRGRHRWHRLHPPEIERRAGDGNTLRARRHQRFDRIGKLHRAEGPDEK